MSLGSSPLAARAAHHASGVSTAGVVIAALAAAVALACALWALARLAAYEPRWALGLGHAVAEAGYRASATWAELTDWLRLGR